eukprot:snap_masked-scaffold_18-processed-gene-0.40-mRNA-1 protein AED:1.00 eAED:1.00 QI:0/0/0/0/1/1/2/0/88
MKVAKICPGGGAFRIHEVKRVQASSESSEILFLQSVNILIEKSEMNTDNFVKKVELRMWKLRFDSQEIEEVGYSFTNWVILVHDEISL